MLLLKRAPRRRALPRCRKIGCGDWICSRAYQMGTANESSEIGCGDTQPALFAPRPCNPGTPLAGAVSKTVVRVTVPWVRIPPSPPHVLAFQGLQGDFDFQSINLSTRLTLSPSAWAAGSTPEDDSAGTIIRYEALNGQLDRWHPLQPYPARERISEAPVSQAGASYWNA